jgi:hypothetical protein
VKFFKQ